MQPRRRALAWAVGWTVAGAACGPGKPPEATASEATASGSSGTSGASSTSTTQAPTGGATSSSGCEGCTGSSSTGGFINYPDGGQGTKECDQWTQDCPEGQKCAPHSGDGDNSFETLKCVPVMPNPGQIGDVCTVEGSGTSGVDSCDVGLICWNVDGETGTGHCVEQCKGSPDDPQCGPGTCCLVSGDGVLTLCLPCCDPLLQDCSGMETCLPIPQDPNRFECFPDNSGEAGQVFDPCDKPTGCDPGLLCANPVLGKECDAMAEGCCLPFCDVTAPLECPGVDQQCLAWFEEGQAPPGGEDVGVCGIPQ